jgi:predicted HTH transcriptional regulator
MHIEKQILEFLKSNPESSSNRILENIEEKKSIATIKRILSKLISEKLISTTGKENLPDTNFLLFINYLKILGLNNITKMRLTNE